MEKDKNALITTEEKFENIIKEIGFQNGTKDGKPFFIPAYELPSSERLRFIFDFVCMKIEEFDIADKLQLVLDVEKYIFRRAIYNANDILNIPTELSGSISDLVQPSNIKKIKAIQKLMQYIIDKFKPIFEGHDGFLELPTLKVSHSAFLVEQNQGKTIIIKSSPEGGDYYLAYFEFVNLLNDIPIDNIKRCFVCERIFYHDRKGGLYCSERCRWKRSSENYRTKNPEIYKERQRKIMQEKYDKTIKEKHGSGTLRTLQEKRIARGSKRKNIEK